MRRIKTFKKKLLNKREIIAYICRNRQCRILEIIIFNPQEEYFRKSKAKATANYISECLNYFYRIAKRSHLVACLTDKSPFHRLRLYVFKIFTCFYLLQANGELYYFSTMVAFGLITYIHPKLWISVYDNFGHILGVLNVLALALCLYLLIRAKLKREESDPYLLQNVN